MVQGDAGILAPQYIIVPQARDGNGPSGAEALAYATTGAMVMSGAKLYVHSGSAWAAAT